MEAPSHHNKDSDNVSDLLQHSGGGSIGGGSIGGGSGGGAGGVAHTAVTEPWPRTTS